MQDANSELSGGHCLAFNDPYMNILYTKKGVKTPRNAQKRLKDCTTADNKAKTDALCSKLTLSVPFFTKQKNDSANIGIYCVNFSLFLQKIRSFATESSSLESNKGWER